MKIRYLIDEVAYDDNGLIISMKHVGEVIRCKDCKHYDTAQCFARDSYYRVKDEDGCVWGEEKK